MTIGFSKQRYLGVGCIVGGLLLAASTASAQARPADHSHSSAGAVLTSNQSNAGPYPDSFNPFLTTSAASEAGIQSEIYEPLLQYDNAKAGTIYDWLASSYKAINNNKTFIFYLRHNVKWSDGTPFTANDVVFTFDLLKRYAAINTDGISFSSVTAVGPYEVKFSLPAPSASELYYIASTYIVPEHIWHDVNPTTFADTQPIGTGPYTLKSFTPEDIQLTRNVHYWGGLPPVAAVNLPMADSNLAADNFMAAGGAQWGGHNFGDVQKLWVDKNPAFNKYWYIPTTTIQLLPNLTVAPLNNVDVRAAISDAINRVAIQNEAELGHEYAINSPTGLLPKFSSEVAPQFSNLRYTVNDSAAKALLVKAGLKQNGAGQFLYKGQPLTLNLVLPSPYADWLTIGGILTSELKSIGIQLNVQGVSLPTWQADQADGSFQLTLNVGNSGPSQYYIYNGLLNDQLTAPIGQTATGDLERWKSPSTQAYLSDYERGTPAQQEAAIRALEAVVVKDVPYIPLINQSGWFQYSTNSFTGWPTAQNPYAQGSPNGLNAEVVLLHLHPKG